MDKLEEFKTIKVDDKYDDKFKIELIGDIQKEIKKIQNTDKDLSFIDYEWYISHEE